MWHEKVESQLRTVERQMASLRSGGAIPVEGTISSDPEIKQALTSQQPSELMIHSIVRCQQYFITHSISFYLFMHVLLFFFAKDELTFSVKFLFTKVNKYLNCKRAWKILFLPM